MTIHVMHLALTAHALAFMQLSRAEARHFLAHLYYFHR